MNNAEQEIDPEQEALRRKKQEKLLAKKAAAQEAQNQLYRDHLKRERDFSDETQRKFFAGWESLCVKVKTEELAEELRQQRQCFGTVIDRKNGCIERLVEEKNAIGEIHNKCLNRLGNIVDYYIRLKDFLTSTMLTRYESECQKLLAEFREEAAGKESFSNAQVEMLEASLAELMAKMKRDELADREWLLESNTENISTQVEKCEIIRDKKFAEMSALYRRLKETLDGYFQTVLYPERKLSYDRMVYYTELEQQAIDHRRCQLAVLQMKKFQLEHTLTLARIGGRRKLRTRQNCRRLLEVQVSYLKEQHRQLDDGHQRLLKWICSVTHHLKKVLSSHMAWGERIAKAGLICSQYETDQDRKFVAKWFQPDPAEDQDPMDHMFDFLTYKSNRVEATNIILREERTRLRRENEELKAKFQSYCRMHKITDKDRLCLSVQQVTPES